MSLSLMSCSRVHTPEMSNFDTQRYLGTWFEICRFDHRFEHGLERVTANYRLREDGKIDVLNRGYDPLKQAWREAKVKGVQGGAKNYLKVYFIPFIGGNYQVAYVDENYTVAVVSGGTLNYLWFMSRTPKVTTKQLKIMIEVAQKLGYDTTKLIYVKQN